VKIETSVLDKQGDFVGGLAQRDFHVLDGGVERPVAFFAPVDAPARVLILLETSPAVYLIHNQHLAAVYALAGGLAPDDEVALVTYDQSPKAVFSFTSDKSALLAALDKAQYTIGMDDLNFYDSLATALDWIAPVPGKKALVLITTGLDSSSPARWDALVQKVRGADVVIFSVELGGSLRADEDASKKRKQKKSASARRNGSAENSAEAKSTDPFAVADEALRSLAAMTGGGAYFPESEQDFVPIYREIASALRHQYVLGIAPAHDNQFHTLAVEVLGSSSQPSPAQAKHPGYRVFARAGYLAPGP